MVWTRSVQPLGLHGHATGKRQGHGGGRGQSKFEAQPFLGCDRRHRYMCSAMLCLNFSTTGQRLVVQMQPCETPLLFPESAEATHSTSYSTKKSSGMPQEVVDVLAVPAAIPEVDNVARLTSARVNLEPSRSNSTASSANLCTVERARSVLPLKLHCPVSSRSSPASRTLAVCRLQNENERAGKQIWGSGLWYSS